MFQRDSHPAVSSAYDLFGPQLFFKDVVIDWIISQKGTSSTQSNGAWEKAAGYTDETF